MPTPRPNASRRLVALPDAYSAAHHKRELQALWDAVELLRGAPSITGALDMNGNRIINVGRSKRNSDVLTKAEAIDDGMHKNARGEHVANSVIIATSGIRSERRARTRYELVPLEQMEEAIAASAGGGDAVLTSNVDQVVEGYKFFRGLAVGSFTVVLGSGLTNAVTVGDASGDPLGVFCRITGGAAGFTLGGLRRGVGLEGGEAGQLVILHNTTSNPLVLIHENGATAAQSRIRVPQASPTSINGMNVRRFGSVVLIYSLTDQRWIAGSFA